MYWYLIYTYLRQYKHFPHPFRAHFNLRYGFLPKHHHSDSHGDCHGDFYCHCQGDCHGDCHGDCVRNLDARYFNDNST